ncbi:MAG: hypothetical protein UW81_C0008G0024 [Candidatus Giovannonibacteria bacterium GW2011_GWC2_44_9]|uniref:Uncharacterized protein n=3 Tax=Candidatus Giovannoniibacteriota TaxID=1752738 RepID=A0A0G1L6D5_9BACT|nr:MAG: hypothetical protein UW49_C0002G0047 [Candidatus Giovannonibacteria bacterium GW2011_GWB1_44_23]KKT64167.1 MAG: hypothetical protein UW57_C0002G0047 [Candidatus Giovannonibacteria bacterium GW2011_GWA1_44_29]KKT83961.1 MAG: hypothetical protein UW81_C0008G0024 [Candidatus Giovannonibacteria bacterium GW2011_GWC2_44_9]KKT91767.1 MAG: hypothetical protein UW93_C0003G0047 [Parcubacteria group bacterium GW2011_GWC1_45_13]
MISLLCPAVFQEIGRIAAAVCLLRSKNGNGGYMHRAGVQWTRGPEPRVVADKISPYISDQFGQSVLYRTVRNLNEVYIDCEEFDTAVILSEQLQKVVFESFGFFCDRQVDDNYIGMLLIEYKETVEKAIADLKATRSWFKDSRIAEIRWRLEKVYMRPGPAISSKSPL